MLTLLFLSFSVNRFLLKKRKTRLVALLGSFNVRLPYLKNVSLDFLLLIVF